MIRSGFSSIVSMTFKTSPAMNSQLSSPLLFAFSLAASTASSTISTPITLEATGDNIWAIVPVPLYKSKISLSLVSPAYSRALLYSRSALFVFVWKNENGGLLVNLVTSTDGLENLDLNAYVEGLLALPLDGTIVGILHTANDSLADAVVPEKVTLLYGRDYIEEEVLGLHFLISPFSFSYDKTVHAPLRIPSYKKRSCYNLRFDHAVADRNDIVHAVLLMKS